MTPRRSFRDAATIVQFAVCLVLSASAHATCDTFNYAGDFVVSNYQLVGQTPVDVDLVEAEISADIHNTDDAELDNVTATPDLAGVPLDVRIDDATFQPLEFGLVEPFATAAATSHMIVRVAPGDLAAFVDQLNDGSIPAIVNGDETLVLKPDVYAFTWTDNADANYEGTFTNGSVIYFRFDTSGIQPLFQDASSLANLNWTFEPSPGMGEPAYCFGSVPFGEQYFVFENGDSGRVDEAGAISGLTFPQILRHGVIDAVGFEPSGTVGSGAQCAAAATEVSLVAVSVLDALDFDIASAVERGTFCTGDEIYLDQPVAQTRFVVDVPGAEEPLDTESEVLERDVQPIRINNLQIGDLRLNGQVQGYALKPRIAIRVKPAGIEAQAGVESDLNMAVQVTADADIPLLNATDVQLAQLCFPLPPVPLGFATLHSSLELTHTLDATASMKAGVTYGIEKQFRGGYRMVWDPARAPGDEFYSETLFSERPLALTPPRLMAEASASASVSTSFAATLRLGDELCTFGGPFVRTVLGVNLDASAQGTPPWSFGHDAFIEAGLTLDLLGFNIAEQSAPVVTFPGSESLGGDGTVGRAGTVAPGVDQRWAINVQDTGSPGGKIAVTDSAATSDGGVVAVTGAGAGGGQERLMRFDTDGRLLWDIQYAGIQTEVTEVDVRADGNILVAGNSTSGTSVWLALHDPDGVELWNRTASLANAGGDLLSLDAMTTFVDGAGAGGILLAGTLGSTTNSTARPGVLRLDENGEALWSRVAGEFVPAGSGDNANWQIYDAIHTRDDGFLVVGSLFYQSFGDFSTTLPIATKLDGDGNVQWQSTFAIPDDTARGGPVRAVDQAASGVFFLTGSIGGTVLQTGSMFVARLSEDGADGKGAILYYSKLPQGSADDTNDDPNHWTTSSGVAESGNDYGFDIVTVDGGAVLVGVYAVDSEAWVVRVNEHLGVEWFNSYDGVFQDKLSSVSVSDTGLIASGVSKSIIPNSALANLAGKSTLMLMKMPFEGLVDDFRPSLDIYRRYVLPTVFQGPTFYDNSPMIRPELADVPLPLIAGTLTDEGSNATLLQTPSEICVTLLTANSGEISPGYVCDADDDGIADIDDNCLEAANPQQRDSNNDGIGNACDADLNNDCSVNFGDLAILKAAFVPNPYNPDADFNDDGFVNFGDLAFMKSTFFNGPDPGPGPSGLLNDCD